MTLRNVLGQKLEVGKPVVLVTQGQGFAYMNLGRIVKYSRQGLPQIQYITRNGRYSDSSGSDISPPVQRYERLFVISEEQYADIEAVQKIKGEWDAQFFLYSSSYSGDRFGEPHKGHDRRAEYEAGLNAAMNAAGKENYYD